MSGIVFVSCGQSSPQERQLGKSIAELIRARTPYEGYFAQNQATFEGFVQNILGAMNRSVAFVGVMHHRGEVNTMTDVRVRASVWIEQEIAVAAFIEQVMGRKVPVRLYVQNGIHREGMREQLLLNPISFEENEEVLKDLASFLSNWASLAPLRSGRSLNASVSFETRRRENAIHYYTLEVRIENDGEETINDFRIDLLFPRRYLQPGTYGLEEPQRSNDKYICLRATQRSQQKVLYPEDSLIINLDYVVTSNIFHSDDAFHEDVTVTLSGDGMRPKSIKKSMRELQAF